MDEIISKEPKIKAVGWSKKIMIESLVRLLVGVREIIIESLVRLLVGVREIIIISLVRLLGEAYQGWYDSMLTKAGTPLFCSGPEICKSQVHPARWQQALWAKTTISHWTLCAHSTKKPHNHFASPLALKVTSTSLLPLSTLLPFHVTLPSTSPSQPDAMVQRIGTGLATSPVAPASWASQNLTCASQVFQATWLGTSSLCFGSSFGDRHSFGFGDRHSFGRHSLCLCFSCCWPFQTFVRLFLWLFAKGFKGLLLQSFHRHIFSSLPFFAILSWNFYNSFSLVKQHLCQHGCLGHLVLALLPKIQSWKLML